MLLHLLAAGLLLRPTAFAPAAPVPASVRLLPLKPPAPVPRPLTASKGARKRAPALPGTAAPLSITLPLEAQAPQAAPAAAGPASAPAPLDLRLPPRSGPTPAPRIAELARADPRANSPRESAETRMAHALGAQGWRSVDLGDGAKKIVGPFGECYISRPSMVEQIPDHPLQGTVPHKIFGCGGIEKGSLKHERPK